MMDDDYYDFFVFIRKNIVENETVISSIELCIISKK